MDIFIPAAVEALRKLGHDDLADLIENAPRKLGSIIGDVIAKGLDPQGNLSQKAIADLKKLNEERKAAPPRTFLDEHLVDLIDLVNSAAPEEVIVIKGFLQDKDCLVLLKIDTECAKPTAEAGSISLRSSWMSVSILADTTNDQEVLKINRDLGKFKGDKVHFDGLVDALDKRIKERVVEITANDVFMDVPVEKPAEPSYKEFSRLNAAEKNVARRKIRKEKAAAAETARRLSEKPRPIRAAAGINEAFRTILIAKQAQGEALKKYRDERSNPAK